LILVFIALIFDFGFEHIVYSYFCNTNRRLSFLFRRRELNVTVLEANIQHLKSSTRYVIHVFAFNSYSYSETPASLTVQTQSEGKTAGAFDFFI